MAWLIRRSDILLIALAVGGCSIQPLSPTAQIPLPGDPRILDAMPPHYASSRRPWRYHIRHHKYDCRHHRCHR